MAAIHFSTDARFLDWRRAALFAVEAVLCGGGKTLERSFDYIVARLRDPDAQAAQPAQRLRELYVYGAACGALLDGVGTSRRALDVLNDALNVFNAANAAARAVVVTFVGVSRRYRPCSRLALMPRDIVGLIARQIWAMRTHPDLFGVTSFG